MPKRNDIRKILVIGAGPIVIGQACEFDYSGTQGIKALKEEGYRVILINSNPATIMTDHSLADVVYIEPITTEFIEQIIVKERPDVILPTLGGQTALNAALLLDELGILKKYNVSLIGVSVDAIRKAEDRSLFKAAMKRIGLTTPPSIIVSSMEHGFDNLLFHLSHLYFEKQLEPHYLISLLDFISKDQADTLQLYLENYFNKNDYFFKNEVELLSTRNNNEYIRLPVIIRPSLTLGGTGGGVCETALEYARLLKSGIEASPIGQIQVDKSIIGWKEFEMEVVRDKNDNVIIVCSIENIDPMGVHTGDSVTVAPAITLTDKEYQQMRDYSIAILREIGVETGGSNVQFAVNPKDGEMLVIEMNPRVSRSSALASKATGFPIAKIAAKLAVGYTLDELKNDIAASIPKSFDYLEYKAVLAGTAKNQVIEKYIEEELKNGYSVFDLRQRALPASFEPSLDYIVVKIPKFNFEKFNTFNPELGTQMQSVGEIMSIGRSFEEAMLKGISSIEDPIPNLSPVSDVDIKNYLQGRFPKRIHYILEGFRRGFTLTEISSLTSYDNWFLERLENIVQLENDIAACVIPDKIRNFLDEFAGFDFKTQNDVKSKMAEFKEIFDELSQFITKEKIFKWKKAGFRDGEIRHLLGLKAGPNGIHLFREYRKFLGILPVFKRIDSCAGEFASATNYFYSSYEESMENEALSSSSKVKKVIIIGSGPNRVGQGIEFDYSCTHAAFSLREMGIESVMINCNPETVSTDYDIADRLFFEPLSDEHVMNVIENESQNCELLGVIIQLGGQTPLKLRQTLKTSEIPILGMKEDAIEFCDNRAKFSSIVTGVGAKEAESFAYTNEGELTDIVQKLDYKCIIRPSSVIGGVGMAILETKSELEYYLSNEKVILAGIINPLLESAIELDIDLMRDSAGNTFIFGILEHIEYAGVHSGDSSCTIQTRSISEEVKTRIEEIAFLIGNKLDCRGLLNIQMAVKDDEVFVIEANPRASRTIPFIAKAIKFPIVNLSIKLMCGKILTEDESFNKFSQKQFKNDKYYVLKDLGFVAVKEPVFSFEKFLKSDIVRGPEMKSLGEVMGIAPTFGLAYAKALIASGHKFILGGNAFVSVKNSDKTERLVQMAKSLTSLGFKLYATKGTAKFLTEHNIHSNTVNKVYEGGDNIVKLIDSKEIHFIINTTSGFKSLQDSFLIRRAIVRNKILHSTTIEGGDAIICAIKEVQSSNLSIFDFV